MKNDNFACYRTHYEQHYLHKILINTPQIKLNGEKRFV